MNCVPAVQCQKIWVSDTHVTFGTINGAVWQNTLRPQETELGLYHRYNGSSSPAKCCSIKSFIKCPLASALFFVLTVCVCVINLVRVDSWRVRRWGNNFKVMYPKFASRDFYEIKSKLDLDVNLQPFILRERKFTNTVCVKIIVLTKLMSQYVQYNLVYVL